MDDTRSSREPTFLAQPPGEGVSTRDWAQAFLEAQSPNPAVRQRGRDALTAMGCQWDDLSEEEDALPKPGEDTMETEDRN